LQKKFPIFFSIRWHVCLFLWHNQTFPNTLRTYTCIMLFVCLKWKKQIINSRKMNSRQLRF
jgi:hypothetical protein